MFSSCDTTLKDVIETRSWTAPKLLTADDAPGSLYLTGGRQKGFGKSESGTQQYEKALILRLDVNSSCIKSEVEYTSPPEACPTEGCSSVFKAGTLAGNRLYVCSNTEILIYDVPGFQQVGYLSLPWFNDVHHVCPKPNGNLLIVSTGLDMVGEVDCQGATVCQSQVLGGDPWARFDREVDYRKVASTKPHASHPNFVQSIGDDVWVTRFSQKDVFCLTQPSRRVEFGGFPHDGVRRHGRIYFTTVNGFVYVVDELRMVVEDVIDLNKIDGRAADLGWVRSILPLEGGLAWVGCSRLRTTKLQENLSWMRHGFKQVYLPTRLCLFDLSRRKLLQEIDLEPHGMNAIFSILPAPAPAGIQAA